MNMIKLVDYSSSSDEERNGEATPTPIKFRGKRVFRRIIQSGGSTVTRSSKKDRRKKESEQETPFRRIIQFDETSSQKDEKKENEEETPIKPKKHWKKDEPMRLKENEQETPTPMKSKKRWTKDESTRLKLALKASINPTTNEHWELICSSLGGNHTVEECKEQAMKLNWKPPQPQSNENKNANEEVQEQELPILNGLSPWRRAVDNRKSRRSVECANKFFDENVNDLTFNGLNLDDSLFTAAFSTPPEQAKCARRPFLIRVVANEDDEKSCTDDD